MEDFDELDEMAGGFFSFLDSETVKCPKCGKVFERDLITGDTFICPGCDYQGNVNELEDGLGI